MKAFLTGCSMVLALAALGLSGCDGGASDAGLPQAGTMVVSPEMQEQMKIYMTPSKPADIAKKKAAAEKAAKAQEAAAK